MFHLVAAVAELEREILRERTRCGIAAARRRGARVGRPRVHVDLEQVLALHRRGESLRSIAKALGLGIGTAHRIVADAVRKPSPDLPLEPPEYQGAA